MVLYEDVEVIVHNIIFVNDILEYYLTIFAVVERLISISFVNIFMRY